MSLSNSFHRCLLRRVVRVFWPDKIKSEELYKKTGALELSQTIAYCRHTLLGHLLKLNIEAPAQKAMDNYYMSTSKPSRKTKNNITSYTEKRSRSPKPLTKQS